MGYEEYRYIDEEWYDCGAISYTANGQQNGTSFSLSASINSEPYDQCGLPVPTDEVETVSLSGQACGSGSGTYTHYYSDGGDSVAASLSGRGNTKQRASRSSASRVPASRTVSKLKTTGAPEASHKTGANANNAKAPNGMAVAEDSTSGPSTWTTTTPRFTVQYASFIDTDHIWGPSPCVLAFNMIQPLGVWKIYKGDAFRGTFRTTQSLLVFNGMTDPQGDSRYAQTGATRNYAWPASPANGSSLSSAPTGDIYNDPYTGADEDNQRYDCYLWNDKGQADTTNMQGHSVSNASPWLDVNMYGLGSDPLQPQFGGINWNVTVSVNSTTLQAYASGTHTCYPAHIIKVNGTTIYEYNPPSEDTFYAARCLTQVLSPINFTTAQNPTQVPSH